MSIVKSLVENYYYMKQRGWNKLYFAIDLHGTIIKPGRNNKEMTVYPEAERGLLFLNSIPYITMILFTSTHKRNLMEFYNWCLNKGIYFPYINENPECEKETLSGDYTKKFYYNVLIDDRAGFDYTTDWDIVIETIGKLISQ